MGHYGEPNLEIVVNLTDDKEVKSLHLLGYNPVAGVWQVSGQDSLTDREEDNE
jgi:hypothetical protein